MTKRFNIYLFYITFLFTSISISQTTEETDNANFEVLKNLELFELVYKNIDLYYVDESNPGELMRKGIDAMLAELDPYTNYIPESKMEDYKLMTTGQYGGIGAVIRKVGNHIAIIDPYEGFPAQKAGLIAGDIFLEIDGKNVENLSTSEISTLLKGQPGSKVEVKIKRGSVTKTVTLEREEIKISAVPYSGMINNEIGYIKLRSFTRSSAKDVYEAFQNLKKEHKMKKLVFDLRGNGGGLLIQAVQMVNYFVEKGSDIVSIKGRYEKDNKIYTAKASPLDENIPIVVLIDGGSASASEIVSGAIQDLDRGVVLGQTSFGKGLVQRPLDLKYNAKIKVTIAKYYTPSGRCIQKLDYSSKKIGEKVTEVDESALSTFKTKNGREVKDGRGIEPDVKMPEKKLSRLTATLLINNIIFNYATQYRVKHESISNPKGFSFSDTDYEDFKQYVLQQDFEYNTESGELMEKLKEKAIEEGYYEESKTQFDKLYEYYKPSKERDLIKFKSEIIEILEDEIVGRYYYQTGRIEHALISDSFIIEAVKILNNPNRYNQILNIK
ncbi:MAG TPA: S41 family peptidase [Crocinitomix sp.]|nr:S41 family peptidase [Crocinitomix sp.]